MLLSLVTLSFWEMVFCLMPFVVKTKLIYKIAEKKIKEAGGAMFSLLNLFIFLWF
jgi:hypothetical protein